MPEAHLKQLLPQIITIAKEAGGLIMGFYQKGVKIKIKSDDSPVTVADLTANEYIIQALSKLSPHYPILSEESEILPFAARKKISTYWLIDPLDGTKEFIKGRDNFTVNIALIHQYEPTLGVVFAPAFNTCYYACKGHGSFKLNGSDHRQEINCRTISSNPTFAGNYEHGGDALRQFLDNSKTHFGDYQLLTLGSSLKMCFVAEGKVDLFPRLWLTSEWDTAAAHCIINEAGGKLVKTDMTPLRYNTKGSLLNPYFFAVGNNQVDWTQFLPETL